MALTQLGCVVFAALLVVSYGGKPETEPEQVCEFKGLHGKTCTIDTPCVLGYTCKKRKEKNKNKVCCLDIVKNTCDESSLSGPHCGPGGKKNPGPCKGGYTCKSYGNDDHKDIGGCCSDDSLGKCPEVSSQGTSHGLCTEDSQCAHFQKCCPFQSTTHCLFKSFD